MRIHSFLAAAKKAENYLNDSLDWSYRSVKADNKLDKEVCTTISKRCLKMALVALEEASGYGLGGFKTKASKQIRNDVMKNKKVEQVIKEYGQN